MYRIDFHSAAQMKLEADQTALSKSSGYVWEWNFAKEVLPMIIFLLLLARKWVQVVAVIVV